MHGFAVASCYVLGTLLFYFFILRLDFRHSTRMFPKTTIVLAALWPLLISLSTLAALCEATINLFREKKTR